MLKRCVERVALRGRGRGRGHHLLWACVFCSSV